MRVQIRIPAALVLIALTALGTNARAAGCVSGGAVGAVAGHVAGHHAVLGAVAGCVTGHEINKHEQEKAQQQQTAAPAPPTQQ